MSFPSHVCAYSCPCGEEWCATSDDNRCAICGRRCEPVEEIEVADFAASGDDNSTEFGRPEAPQRRAREEALS
jgi:hypothetical protein